MEREWQREGGYLMGFVEDLQQAEQNLAAASAFHANAVNAALAALQQAEQAYWERVRSSEAAAVDIREAYAEGLLTCAGITLYPDRVTDGKTMFPLTPGVYTSVSAAGNIRYGGGDCRTLSITIDFPNGMRITAMGDPDKEGEAREFAALVMNTAAKTDGAPPTLEQDLARLQRELDAARADTRELDAARAAYQAAYYDTAAIQAAEQVLAALRAQAPQAAQDYEEAKRKRRQRDRFLAVVAAVAAVAALAILGFAVLSYFLRLL